MQGFMCMLQDSQTVRNIFRDTYGLLITNLERNLNHIKMHKQEMVASALPLLYLKKLHTLFHRVFKRYPTNETIVQLKELEPEIVAVVEDNKILNDLKRKSNLASTVSNKGGRRMTSITNDDKDGDTGYKTCIICKKCHSRECCLASKNKHGGVSGREKYNKEKSGCLTMILNK